jgi:apolipoprotein N-acyltransferase
MRAVEEGLPVVRAANTGISAIVDANGDVVARLDTGERGIIDASLPGARAPTLYARLGDWTLLVLIIGNWILIKTEGTAGLDRNARNLKTEEI